MSVVVMQNPSFNHSHNSSWLDQIERAKNVEPDSDSDQYFYSSSQMSQNRLEVCTENLGSETGSDYYDLDPEPDPHHIDTAQSQQQELVQRHDDEEEEHQWYGGKQLKFVNYTRQRTPFPPPLTSISRRDGPCLHVRPFRCDGRLVFEAVAVPSQNYLHARREAGRLRLSFVEAYGNGDSDGELEEKEKEEVCDMQVNCSTVVRNESIEGMRSGSVAEDGGRDAEMSNGRSQSVRSGETVRVGGLGFEVDGKVGLVWKRRNRRELVDNVRRCSQVRRPLLVWEPYSVAARTWA